MGRDIQPILGYDKWDNFKHTVIEKAREACRAVKIDPKDHFLDVGKMITAGKGAVREREDFYLTRYACYLIAMNGGQRLEESETWCSNASLNWRYAISLCDNPVNPNCVTGK